MFYAIFLPPSYEVEVLKQDLIFTDIKEASKALKKYQGSRMKSFHTRERAEEFLIDPSNEESFMELSFHDTSQQDELTACLDRLSITSNSNNQAITGNNQAIGGGSPFKSPYKIRTSTPNNSGKKVESQTDDNGDSRQTSESSQSQLTNDPEKVTPNFPTPQPADLTKLRRKIEAGELDEVETMIWQNPRLLCTVCDSAVYLMAGPKYNACHIAARANKPEITALILDTVSNSNFMRLLYPNESDSNVKDRLNHLLDSYLNTPDPRQGNTPLQFACKLGHARVVKVLLTFDGCDQNIRDSQSRTAEECICLQNDGGDPGNKQRIKDMFKLDLNLPIHRDQLKKRLSLIKKAHKAGDSDVSFSDDSFIALIK